jgi:RNA-directed DNA polymerase
MNVGEMQRKLSLWAEQNKERRFYGLYQLLYDRNWLRLAHDYVKQNAGSVTAGCDGINIKLYDERLEDNLDRLAAELKSENFEPCPVRRVYIPKANGKSRPLGIASIRDRIVQEALRMILEPIYEADFSQYSFGFRPNRCTMDAIKCITWSTQEQKKFFWIVEGDVSSYFDTICHRKLIKLLWRRINDEKLLTLIWKFLRAGVMEGKLFKATELGVPQGGIVSPVLANVYLHELDRFMEKYTGLSREEKTRRRRQGLANFTYARYADDFAALCNGTRQQAEELREELYNFLADELHLQLSMEKTKITHLNDGFQFLGFQIQRRPGHNGMKTKVLIPQVAMDKLMEKIARVTDPSTHRESLNSKILALNRIIGGWCRYYQYTSQASTIFNQVEYQTFWKMVHWLGRKFQITTPVVLTRYKREGTIAIASRRLQPATEFQTLIYKKRFLKPNPYTMQEILFQREELPQETFWTGCEPRPGLADLRPLIMKRDDFRCQLCDRIVSDHIVEIDHIKPVRRFKRPVDANVMSNLWTLCVSCHQWKTEYDRRMESCGAAKVACPVR